jgi:Mg-chelatase subunit ChlD
MPAMSRGTPRSWWRTIRIILLAGLPVVFLTLYLLRLPVYVPAFLLPRTVFLEAAAAATAEEIYAELSVHPTLNLLRAGEVLPVRRKEFPSVDSLRALLERTGISRPEAGSAEEADGTARQAGVFEEQAVLTAYLPGILAAAGRWSRVLIILEHFPQASELAALRALQRSRRLPVRLEVRATPYRPLFMACSYTRSTQENTLSFELLFSSEVKGYRTIRVFSGGALWQELTPAALEQGREYHATLPAEQELSLRFELEGETGSVSRTIRIASRQEQQPQVLMVSGRTGSLSFLERLYSVKKVSLAEALQEDLPQYPLLVFDGIPLKSLGPQLTDVLSDIYRRKASSLLFIADSPSFGRKGDNPTVEQMLPTELTPRSLQYLPDLGILILLDVSASMMGDKLSLAKVSTLELLKNLKDSDRVSMLTFWDQYRFLNGFQEKRSLDSAGQLAPLVAQGGTDMHQALAEGLKRLSALDMPQKHVIILSDGKTKEADFEPLIRQALVDNVTISTLAVGEEVNSELMSQLARKTGGNTYRVLSLQEIPSIIFEDRKQIARSSFATDRFTISDASGREVGSVQGMSLFAPKPEAVTVYRNQFEDPLLAVKKRDRQVVMMFLSDMYGYYTSGLLRSPEVVRTVTAMLDAILQPNRLRVRVAEALGALSFTVSGEGLLQPVIAVYAHNRLLQEVPLREGPLHLYSGAFAPPGSGEYTAVLYSRGEAFLRLPVFCNGTLEGRQTDAEALLQGWRPLAYRAIPASGLYLVLFFLSSVGLTFLSRRLSLFGRVEA